MTISHAYFVLEFVYVVTLLRSFGLDSYRIEPSGIARNRFADCDRTVPNLVVHVSTSYAKLALPPWKMRARRPYLILPLVVS
jgi:hypothetical protein